MSVKCVILWVQEYADTISINNHSGIWKFILTLIYLRKIIIGEPRCQDSINPVYKFLCLTIFYLPKIQLSASPYLVQSHSQQVLFTRSAIQYHPMIKLISHVFATVYDIDYRVSPEYISPSHKGQISISIHATQQVLSDYLRDIFIITFS
jgi:hypothetical protein